MRVRRSAALLAVVHSRAWAASRRWVWCRGRQGSSRSDPPRRRARVGDVRRQRAFDEALHAPHAGLNVSAMSSSAPIARDVIADDQRMDASSSGTDPPPHAVASGCPVRGGAGGPDRNSRQVGNTGTRVTALRNRRGCSPCPSSLLHRRLHLIAVVVHYGAGQRGSTTVHLLSSVGTRPPIWWRRRAAGFRHLRPRGGMCRYCDRPARPDPGAVCGGGGGRMDQRDRSNVSGQVVV